LKGLFVNYLYVYSYEPINLPSLFSDLKEIKQLLHEIAYARRKTTTSSLKRTDVASGIKTIKNKTKNNIFRRKLKQRRFKNPIFLSLK
jgi:hypothetical protein